MPLLFSSFKILYTLEVIVAKVNISYLWTYPISLNVIKTGAVPAVDFIQC